MSWGLCLCKNTQQSRHGLLDKPRRLSSENVCSWDLQVHGQCMMFFFRLASNRTRYLVTERHWYQSVPHVLASAGAKQSCSRFLLSAEILSSWTETKTIIRFKAFLTSENRLCQTLQLVWTVRILPTVDHWRFLLQQKTLLRFYCVFCISPDLKSEHLLHLNTA